MEQLAFEQTAELVQVDKAVVCNKCGVKDSGWVKGRKSGKYYLARLVPTGPDGILYASRFDFHKCDYNDILAHRKAEETRQANAVKPRSNPFMLIPDGRYAIRNAENVVEFFEVDQPPKGNRWHGWTFVKRLIGNPGDYRKVRIKGDAATAILKQLVTDPLAAMTLYGKESGVCGNCASPLSDPESLARGLGPICAENLAKKVMA